jgi:hypothetical protein
MNETILYAGIILVAFGGVVCYCFILCSIRDTRNVIVAKQDAIMAKLIEIKLR